MIGTKVTILDGPLHEPAWRRVVALTHGSIVLGAAGDGPELVFSWSNQLVSGPGGFAGSRIDPDDVEALREHRPKEDM